MKIDDVKYTFGEFVGHIDVKNESIIVVNKSFSNIFNNMLDALQY